METFIDFEDEENRRTSSKMAFDAAEDSEYFKNDRFTASRLEPCDAVSEVETLAYSFENLTGNHSPIIYQSPVGSPSAKRDALPSPVHSLYSNKPELIKTSPQPHLWVFPTQRSSSPISPQFPRDVIVSQRSAPSLASLRIKKNSSMIQSNIANTSEQIIVNISNNTFTQNNLMETGEIDPDKPFLIITGDYNYNQRSIRLLDPNQPFTHSDLNPNRNIIMDFLRQNNFELVNDCELICVRGQKLRDLYFLLQKNTKQLSIGRLGYDGKEIQLWPLISQFLNVSFRDIFFWFRVR